MHLSSLVLAGALAIPALSACDAVVQPLQRQPWVPQAPNARSVVGAGDERVTLAVSAIVKQRCTPCHSANPTRGSEAAPAGVMFDTSDQILAMKDRIKARTVDSRTMPLLNLTGMTDEERAVIGRWIEALPKS